MIVFAITGLSGNTAIPDPTCDGNNTVHPLLNTGGFSMNLVNNTTLTAPPLIENVLYLNAKFHVGRTILHAWAVPGLHHVSDCSPNDHNVPDK